MADARRMGKMELFAHFADKFDMKRTQVRDLFDELNRLSEKELKRSGEFVLPGMCTLVVQKRKARDGRILRANGINSCKFERATQKRCASAPASTRAFRRLSIRLRRFPRSRRIPEPRAAVRFRVAVGPQTRE